MENNYLRLSRQLAINMLGKNFLGHNRSGLIDSLNNPKYQKGRDFGQIYIFNNESTGYLSYSNDLYDFSITGYSDKVTPNSLIELIDKESYQLKYKEKIFSLNYLIDNVKAYYDEELLKRTNILVLKKPHVTKEQLLALEKKYTKEVSNPFEQLDTKDDEYYIELRKLDPGTFEEKSNLGDLLIAIKDNNFKGKQEKNFYSKLREVKSLTLNNLTIDDKFVETISLRFPQAKIVFNNCNLECTNLYLLKKRDLEFFNMTINLDYLNNSECNLKFTKCNIYNTKFIKLLCRNLVIEYSNIDFNFLSYTSNFEKIEDIEIQYDKAIDIDDIERNFKNVKNLKILSNITNYYSITKLYNLDNYMIGEKSSTFDVFYHELSDAQRNYIKTKYHNDYLIEKIKQGHELNDLDLNLIEKNNLLRLCKFNKSISMDNSRIDILKKYKTFLEYIKSNDFPNINDGQYVYDGKLILNRDELYNNFYAGLCDETYDIYMNYLVKRKLYCMKNDIYKSCGNLIFNYDGRPIIYSSYNRKYIDTVEDAKRFSKKVRHQKETNDDDYVEFDSDYIIKYIINDIPPYPMEISLWNETMGEVTGCYLFTIPEIYNRVLEKLKSTYGDQLKHLYDLLDSCSEINKEQQEIDYNNKLNEMISIIEKNYYNLSKEEIINLLIIIDDNHFLKIVKYASNIKNTIDLMNISKKCNYDFDKNIKKLHNIKFRSRFDDVIFSQEAIDELNKIKIK